MQQSNIQKETNYLVSQCLIQILLKKHELFKQIMSRQPQRESLIQIFKEYDELQQIVKLNSKLREDFAVLEKLLNMAVEN
ncbi:unnamed protein product [Paramecium primaurelia]|uniref:Uncharacterized protein n=1 Tax=Paramecium primaurelia TaxID=5886 RepID=A0A8S1M809_PARPR|nr:unnamed protein product [Paramecium primaurelia]